MPAKKGRKSAAKKSASKSAMKKAAKTAKPKKLSAVSKAMTKGEIMTNIADMTSLTRKDVAAVLEGLGMVMHSHLNKRGVGEFTLPGLMKCRVVRKPATKARKGINPFTGEETMFKAKPARNVVKIRPLKKLKEMAE